MAATLTRATGTAEREAALALMDKVAERSAATQCTRGRTLGSDKNYDTADFVTQCRERKITPHVAQNTRRTMVRGLDRMNARYQLALAGGNLVLWVNLTG